MDVKLTSACAPARGYHVTSFAKFGFRQTGTAEAEPTGIRCKQREIKPIEIKSARRKFFCKGTSLMDVLTTLAVASVLLGGGIPGFQHYLADSRLVSSTNLLSRSLALARSEAVKRESHVVICKSQDQQTCTSAGSWRQGWIIFEDHLPDRQRDEDESLIFAKSELPTAVSLDYKAFRSSNFIAFRPTGITKTNGTFTLCYNEDTNSARALILSKTGRVRFSRTRADGHPLHCPEES